MKIKHPLRLTLLSICVLSFSALIVLSIIKIINSEHYSSVDHLKLATIKAERGNIYTYDYQLLAVTSTNYELRFDGTYLRSSDAELEELASDLSKIFLDKSKNSFLNDLRNAKNQKYFLLKREASLSQINQLQKINFYNKPLNGGLIVKQYSTRQKPNKNSASRTIGDLFKENGVPIYGLEYSYNSQLMGKDGRQLVLHEPGVDRIVNSSDNILPESGKDLITTIELSYQDILEQAVLRQLEKFEADFGTAILMEVETGQIKAITNLEKTKDEKYAETYNFGVVYPLEPGSTFKLASLMAYFENFNGTLQDTIDCKNGQYKFKGAPIFTFDSEPLGKVSIQTAFAQSSNIGIGRLIVKYFNSAPRDFVNRIYNFGLGKKSNIDLNKVPHPNIKFPGDKSWSGISLPWMSYGYGIHLTALDILTFYNSIANQGFFISPYLGYALRTGSYSEQIQKENMPFKICSESTISKAHALLREVVLSGTGKDLNSLSFPVSGKTGTTVKNYSLSGDEKIYQSSFVGFFPSNKPKYTCIVVIDNPNKKIGYYGSQVAVPAFKEIAQKIYLKEGIAWNSKNGVIDPKWRASLAYALHAKKNEILQKNIKVDYYPSVVGMHVTDAVYLLKNLGYEVIIQGDYGNVKKQYPQADSKVKKDLAITLFI